MQFFTEQVKNSIVVYPSNAVCVAGMQYAEGSPKALHVLKTYGVPAVRPFSKYKYGDHTDATDSADVSEVRAADGRTLLRLTVFPQPVVCAGHLRAGCLCLQKGLRAARK